MKKVLSIIIALTVILTTFTVPAFADTVNVKIDIDKIIDFKLNQSNFPDLQSLVSNGFASSPASGEEWYIFALRNYFGEVNYNAYREALKKYVSENEIKNVVSRQRTALSMLALGITENDSDFLKTVIDDTTGNLGIMSYTFGLLLMNNGCKSEKFNEESLIDILLGLQIENGGWAINGKTTDIDTTSMVIQALSSHYDNPAVKDAIDKAVNILSSMQKENGGYATFGNENPESAAQIIIALTSIGFDPLDDKFIKNGNTLFDAIKAYQLPDGSFSHIKGSDYNSTATVQVLSAYIAYQRFLDKKSAYYAFDKNDLIEPAEDNSVQNTENTSGNIISKKSIQLILSVVIIIIAIATIILFIKHNKRYKTLLTALVVCIAVLLGVSFIKIESIDSHYNSKSSSTNLMDTTLSIRCETVAGKKDYIPEDGIILDFVTIKIPEGSTAYDQLIAAAKQYKIQLETQSGSSYVQGIANIYEFDFDDLSGWMLRINGEWSGTGSSDCKLNPYDYVEWIYTTQLGKDIGNDYLGE